MEETLEDELLRTAAAVTEAVENGDEYSEITELIAAHYAKRGDLDRALELVESIPDPYVKDHAIATTAVNIVDAGLSDDASELIDNIEDAGAHALAIEQLAVKFAQVGEYDRALQALEQLDDKAEVQRAIATIYGEKGMTTEAVSLANSIDFPISRVSTLLQLATQSVKKNEVAEAEELLAAAKDGLDDLDFPEDRINGLLSIANVYAGLKEEEQALQHVLEAYNLCDEIENPDTRDQSLAEVAGLFAELNQLAKADEIIERVGDPFQFSLATISLAMAYHKQEHTKQAEELLAQAGEVTTEAPVSAEHRFAVQNGVLLQLAYCYAICGNYQKGIESAFLIKSPEVQVSALNHVGKFSAVAGEDPTKIAKVLPDSAARASYWVIISEALREAHQNDRVEDATKNAVSEAEIIPTPYEKSLALAEIAVCKRNQGQDPDDLFREALLSAALIPSRHRKARALLNLAQKISPTHRAADEDEQRILAEIVVSVQ